MSKKRYIGECIILVSCCCALLVGGLADFGVIPLPSFILVRSGTGIYSDLFAGQASISAIGLAIVSLLTGAIDKKIYGMPVTRYVMQIRHIAPFTYRFVVIAVIVLTALDWAFIALGFYNLSVSVFLVTLFMLAYLASEVISVIHAAEKLNGEIQNFVLDRKNASDVVALFNEMGESVTAGNLVTFNQDYEFAIKAMQTFLVPGSAPKIVDALQDSLLSLVHTTNEVGFSATYKVLDLFVRAFECANKDRENVLPLNGLYNFEIFEILSKTQYKQIRDYALLDRWQWAAFTNEYSVKDDRRRGYGNWIAVSLYRWLNVESFSQIDDYEDAISRILNVSYRIIDDATDEQRTYAEDNALSLVISLLKKADNPTAQCILKSIFGFQDDDSLFVLCYHYDFKSTDVNNFIIMYTYYLAYREPLVADNDIKSFYQQLLEKVANRFWSSVEERYAVNRNIESADSLRTFYARCRELLRWNELHKWDRRHTHTSVKALVFDNVTLDFFAFAMTHLIRDRQFLEDCIRAIILRENNSPFCGTTATTLLLRYADDSAKELYTEFCSIIEKPIRSYIDEEYDKLRSAVINIYRTEQIDEANEANEKFAIINDDFSERLNATLKESTKKFLSQFEGFFEDELEFRPCHWSNAVVPITNWSDSNGYLNAFERSITRGLGYTLVKAIEPHLKLTFAESRKQANLEDFFGNIEGLNVNMLTGFSRFFYDPCKHERYFELEKGCKHLDANNSTFHAAFDGNLIKVATRNESVIVREFSDSDIQAWISDGYKMGVNNIEIPFEDNISAEKYIRNSFRVVEVSVEMAVSCSEEIIGGGLSFE